MFLWCHSRHLNLDCVKPNRITKENREILKKINYSGVDFPVSKKDYDNISILNKININVFCYENRVVYLMTLLIITCILKILTG